MHEHYSSEELAAALVSSLERQIRSSSYDAPSELPRISGGRVKLVNLPGGQMFAFGGLPSALSQLPSELAQVSSVGFSNQPLPMNLHTSLERLYLQFPDQAVALSIELSHLSSRFCNS